jgi:S-adenosylmethionine/arginine decarboxylase-like enzyme
MRVGGFQGLKSIINFHDERRFISAQTSYRKSGSCPSSDGRNVLTEWLQDFITSINMKVLMGPYVIYHDVPGNRGITGAAIIETSHIVMHVWDECSPALMQFDVYSCGAFDPETICRKITKDFDVTKIEYKFIDRENNLTDIGGGSFKPLTAKSYEDKIKLEKEKVLLKNRKEVDINKDGSGYTIKEGPNKGKTLAHIRIPTRGI